MQHSIALEEITAWPSTLPQDRLQRVLDVLAVIASAPLWMPVLAVLCTLKLVLDGGSILFRHVRLGRHGQPFTLYKIRTTPAGFEARPEDWPRDEFPPRTRFGRWLRLRDLDELPQLWNVLAGDMSLVGPRPETPHHAARFAARFPGYSERFTVRPGLTGLAQIRGWRGDTSIRERVVSDLEYLAGRGPRAWLRILIHTFLMEIVAH